MLKKLDKLLIKSFVTPMVTAFLVVLLLLVLQFLAKYIEDITGRGLSGWVMLKIFLLSCGTLVTMALPLAVLLASLSAMGNLGENYELAAAKSSGISLVRLVRPLFFMAVLIAVGSMFYSFYVQPAINLKFFSLLYDVSKVKPTFALKADHFYSDIDGYVIYVSDVNRERDILYDVQIYDNSQEKGNLRVCYADSGHMVRNDRQDYLFLTLYNGVSHEGEPDQGPEPVLKYRRVYFDTLEYRLKLTGYDLKHTEETTFAPHHYMKNIEELTIACDSIGRVVDTMIIKLGKESVAFNHFDSSARHPKLPTDLHGWNKDSSILYYFHRRHKAEILTKALNNSRGLKNTVLLFKDKITREKDKQRRFQIEWHFRIELPTAVIVFLFLGASLGAIVRKGGLGYPVLFSVLFFIIFYVLLIQGRKFARDQILPVWAGVWLPVLVMLPFALAFTWQATTERSIFDLSGWKVFFRRIFFFIPAKKEKS